MKDSLQITPVILCGGIGSRLWPRSRKDKPKPFLSLIDQLTLFESTLARCSDGRTFSAPVIVTGNAHIGHVEAQLGDGADSQVIVEPCAKNTAAAIALAAFRLPEDAIMLVCPSDHHIADVQAFRDAALKAANLAAEHWLVSFGIDAKTPETGFGYLERGEAIGILGYRTARFIEKPDAARAEQFVASGNHAWNGGIFAFRVGTFLSELEAFRPQIWEAARNAVASGTSEGRLFFPEATAFARIEGESVDYAVMENTSKAALVPADMGWSDIGSWTALHAAMERDPAGNSVRGEAQLVDCEDVLVNSDGPRVSVIGLSGVAIVVDGNDILITSHAGAQLVGKLDGATNQ